MSQSIGKNVIKLSTSKVATQAISFITGPIIARLFLPEHYGIVQIYGSISGIIIVISCLRYELSIPLGKDKREVISSFILSISIALVFALIVLALVPFMKGKLALWFKSPELEKFLWILPLSIFIGGFGGALRYYAAQQGRFGAMAWMDFASSFINTLFLISIALIIGASPTLLFAGSIITPILAIFILLAFLLRYLISDIKTTGLDKKILLTIVKRHRKFPIFDAWSGLLNTISHNLPVFIMGTYFSKTIVGYYSLGIRMVSIPAFLMSSSISQVFFPIAAREYNTSQTLSIVNIMFKKLVQLSVFPMITIAFLGATLFQFVFGKNWFEAGVYTQILSGYVLFQFLSSPMSSIFPVLQNQDKLLIWNIGFVLSKFSGLIIGTKIGNPRITLVLYCFISMFYYGFLLIWILLCSNTSIKLALGLFFKYLLLSCLLILPINLLYLYTKNISFVFIGLGLATVIYLWYIYRTDVIFRNYIIRFINLKKGHAMDVNRSY